MHKQRYQSCKMMHILPLSNLWLSTMAMAMVPLLHLMLMNMLTKS